MSSVVAIGPWNSRYSVASLGAGGELRPGGERLVVALLLIHVLEDVPDLDQLGDGGALPGAEVAKVGRQADRFGLLEDRAALLLGPRRRLGRTGASLGRRLSGRLAGATGERRKRQRQQP